MFIQQNQRMEFKDVIQRQAQEQFRVKQATLLKAENQELSQSYKDSQVFSISPNVTASLPLQIHLNVTQNLLSVHPDQNKIIPENFESKNQQNIQESSVKSITNLIRSGRQQKFKRSTNNSHKKFISIARRWIFKNNSPYLKIAFESKFKSFKSTRTYFFIILAFIKSAMTIQKQNQFKQHFERQVTAKISQYERQIQNTQMENLKHFRQDEITDLKYSIKACEAYFQGDIDKSIECIYKKDKAKIIKKQHYQEALKTVRSIQQELEQPNAVENMVEIFGGKKGKSKLTSNQNEQKGEKKDLNEKGFMFGDFMNLNTKLGLFSECGFGNYLKGIRKTEKDDDSSEQDESKVEEIQKFQKRINTIMVIGPGVRDEKKLEDKKPLVGFRPYCAQ